MENLPLSTMDKGEGASVTATYILRLDRSRMLKRAAYEMFKDPRPGDLLMDTPRCQSRRRLRTYVCNREYWRTRVREFKQPRLVNHGVSRAGGRWMGAINGELLMIWVGNVQLQWRQRTTDNFSAAGCVQSRNCVSESHSAYPKRRRCVVCLLRSVVTAHSRRKICRCLPACEQFDFTCPQAH